MTASAYKQPSAWTVAASHTVDQFAWDKFLSRIPHSCVFDTAAWQNAVCDTYKQRLFWLTVQDQAGMRGVLPLALVGNIPFHRVLATGAFASYGNVCADEASVERALIDHAIDLTIAEGASYLELKSTLPLGHQKLLSRADYQTYKLELGEPRHMWDEILTGKARTAVRKAESAKLKCRHGHHVFEPFYQIMTENMRRLGTPVHSKMFYQNIVTNFGQDAEILVCYYEQVPIATLLNLRYKQVVINLCAASRSNYWRFRPNEFIYWEAMKRAYSSGAKQFDFGRSLKESGPAAFKKSMGGKPENLHYQYFLNLAKEIPQVDQRNRWLHVLTKTWSHLPLPMTRLLGPSLIRNIP
jgi:serine/alanine adding enzyme